MNESGYKQLSCRSIGNECDFMIRAGTEEEVLRMANYHLSEVHDVWAVTSELEDKIIKSIESKLCEEGVCAFSP
jgi:predicted small metal-binding protein